jgi:hypothetical protein
MIYSNTDVSAQLKIEKIKRASVKDARLFHL